MDKIYSRKRIRIPKIKYKKINKIKLIILIIFIIIIVSIVSFGIASYPIFIASCQTAAGSKATHIVSEEVEKVMSDYSYDELIDIEKDDSGKITIMQSNVVLINKIIATIENNIQTQIDNSPTTEVSINYGSVSGISMLKFLGPKFNIELETAGKINSQLKSEFTTAGVNQTLHRIYLDINTKMNILTPIGCYGRDIDSEVLLTEAVIVGDIPNSFYNFEGLTEEDSLNLLE